MSKHSVRGGDVAGLLHQLAKLRDKARARTGETFPVIVIQEAGLDGFWLHRVLETEGIESHVVDAASILTSRRRRRAKTDRIDGEALLRTLLAYKRGEPRVCAMVRAPTPQEEDRRRLCRERKTLVAERVEHVNRIKGLLFAQGIPDYEPLHRDRRQRLEELTTATDVPCRPTWRRRSAANSTGWNCSSSNSRPWRRSGMLCSSPRATTDRHQRRFWRS
jgi:transposase